MATCKSCGAPIKIGQKCSYCGCIAEPSLYPELRPDIPEVHSVAEFYAAFNSIVNKYMFQPANKRTVEAFEDDLNLLIYNTPANFVPHEFRVNMDGFFRNGDVCIEVIYPQES